MQRLGKAGAGEGYGPETHLFPTRSPLTEPHISLIMLGWTTWTGRALFQDLDGHLWEVAWNPQMTPVRQALFL